MIPSLGEIVYLASCAIQMDVSALTTSPDTPNQYTAGLKVMGDAGDMSLDAVMGPPGPDGQALFALRDATRFGYDFINDPAELPVLTSSPNDIGLYWLLDELDDAGHILSEWCYIWWGSYYRRIMMGAIGNPGPVPRVDLLMTLVAPDAPPRILTSGSILAPSWEFLCPSPIGAPGPVNFLMGFDDVNEVANPPAARNVLAFTGDYTHRVGKPRLPLWVPFDIEQYMPQPHSMPQTDFTPYFGVSQQAPIGSFELPAQSFPWTPIVWGHLAAGGLTLGTAPLMIGCQVLLNDQQNGQQVARGLGNTLGEINIMPHYSTPGAPHSNITPTNSMAVIPAGTTATLYVNLWNDGQLGAYAFTPTNQPSPLQSALTDLIAALGNPVVTIENIVTMLGAWTASIPTQIQTQLDAVANLLGASPLGQIVNATTNQVAQFLTQFQPLVKQLADALGITAIENLITEVITSLQSWVSTITTEIQDALDSVARQFGLPSLGSPIETVVTQLTTLQPTLQNLANLLGAFSIPNVLTMLEGYAGTITADVQGALNAVAGTFGLPTIGQTIGSIHGYLTSLQNGLNGVFTAFGGTINGGINDVVSLISPFITTGITGLMSTSISVVMEILNVTGLEPTVMNLLQLLMKLLGDIFSGYTTDAQMFVMVSPRLHGTTSFPIRQVKAVTLAGNGTLTGDVRKNWAPHGHGALSAAARMYRIKVAAGLSGHGALSDRTVRLRGRGTLTGTL